MKNLSKTFGNSLITISLISLAYIYYPILLAEYNFRFGPKVQASAPTSEFSIVIPKLNISETVFANTDPFNQEEYSQILTQGVAHAKNTSLPGQSGNVFLFAHSSDNPFSITRYNTAFYLLPKLAPGDEISLYYNTQEYKYRVREAQTVKPWQAEALTTDTRNQLTLQTCTPVGTSINRLLVFADPI
jgi:LPXTG-site transpeptidase (sortase) family protein